MDVTDENEFLPSNTGSFRKLSSDIPQLYVSRQRRSAILAELEPISETNTFSNYNLNSKGNLSLTDFAKQKRRHDKLSKTFSCIPSLNVSNNSFLESSLMQNTSSDPENIQTTPPSVLRKRIKDVEDYMQKQLDELREFTTAERQILLAEKGFETLQEEHDHLKQEFNTIQEQNSNLKMELEKSSQISNSQEQLINNLKENFENLKRQLITAEADKANLVKELDLIKRKLVDEEYKNELTENKLKKREVELTKSLEEAWNLNKIKDERLAKMKDKVSLIYSERIMSSDFLNQSIPIEIMKGFDSKVADLYNLSVSNFENDVSPVSAYQCNCDSNEGGKNTEAVELNKILLELQEKLETQKHELLDLTHKLKEKENDIEFFNTSLNNLSYSFQFHKNVDNSRDTKDCSIHHKNMFERITCEFSRYQKIQIPSQINERSTSAVEEVELIRNEDPVLNSKSDSGVHLVTDTKSDLSNNNLNALICKDERSEDELADSKVIISSCMADSCRDRIKSLENQIIMLENSLNNKGSKINTSRDLFQNEIRLEDSVADLLDKKENAVLTDALSQTSFFNIEVQTENTQIKTELSCQTDLNFSTIIEYENRISDLEKDLSEASKTFKNVIETNNVFCQTLDNFVDNPDNILDDHFINPVIKVNKSVQSYEGLSDIEMNIHKSIQCICELEEVACQTDPDSNLIEICNLREEIQRTSLYKEEIESLKSEIDFYKNKTHCAKDSNPIDHHSDTNFINELQVHESTVSSCTDTICLKDNQFTQTDEICVSSICISCISREENANNEDINESGTTICETEENLTDIITSKIEGNKSILKPSESNSSDSSDCTFETTSEFASDKSPLVQNMFNTTLSDSNRLESSQDLEMSNNTSSTEQSSLLFEYVGTPAPDTTTFNMTFSSHLEHSILASKLTASDANTTIAYDPLATQSEVSRPLVETPFSYSLGLISETKLLEDKCKTLSDELKSLQTYNRKCLSVLTEIDRLLCPEEHCLQDDIVMKAKETIFLLKEVIDSESDFNGSIGLLGSYKNMKSMFNNFLKIKNEMRLLKTDHLSLTSYLHSIRDTNKGLDKARSALVDLSQMLEINEDSNKLLKVNYRNLITENNELKEQISQLNCQNSQLKETSLLFDELIGKNSELQNILLEKDQYIRELNDFKCVLQSFINNTNDFGIIEGFDLENQVFDVCYSKNILSKIEKMLKDLSNSYKLIDGFNVSHTNLTGIIESLFNEKYQLKTCNETLSLNLHSIQKKVKTLENVCKQFKESFTLLTSDFQNMGRDFSQNLNKANDHIEQLIKSKLNDLNELHKENMALKCQVNEISSCSSKYSESSNQLELALKECQSKYDALTSKITTVENENTDLKTSIIKLEEDVSIKSKEIDNLLLELKKIEEEYSKSLNDLKEANSKHCEVNSKNIKLNDVICNLEKDILDQKNQINLFEQERLNCKELENINSELKERISHYELEIQQKSDMSILLSSLQNEYEALKVKLDDFKEMEKLFSELKTSYEDSTKQLDALNTDINDLKLENEVLRSDQNKYLVLLENLQLLSKLSKNFDDSFHDKIWENLKDSSEDIFMPIKEVFSELKDARNNICELKLTLDNLKDEKTTLVKNIESLNIEKEMSIDAKKKCAEEMNNLIRKEQLESEQLKEVIRKYDTEVSDVLSLLQSEDPHQITDDSWAFIKHKINLYKNQVRSNSDDETTMVSELNNKIMSLESQLLDSDNFKRKFSKEIHGLKPDLKVPDLIKLSLEDLQLTFLSTIMEKESDIIADLQKNYELKLTQSSDMIRQLEEEGKRTHDWIKEIEGENDRLQNDCREIQHENENLKSDIKEKKETILKLEEQIEKQKDSANEPLYFDHYNELEKQEQEKSFIESNLQDKINDLTRTLESKSKECQEAFECLQNKSKTIFQLERTLNDTKLEKSHLEEEVKRLKEELNNQISSYEECKKKMETEIEHYKSSLDKSTKNENIDKCMHNIEIPGLLKFLEKLGKDTDTFLKDNVEHLLDNHLQRVDKLNCRLKELSTQMNNHNGDLKNKESIILQLEAEVNKLRDGNVLSKGENDQLKIYISQYQASLEDNKLLRKKQEELQTKLEEMAEEREALIQSSIDNQKAMKDQIIALKDDIKAYQSESDLYKIERNEFVKIKEEYHEIQKEIELLNNLLKQSQDETKNIQEENKKLDEQLNLLRNENSKIQNSLQECLTELQVLKDTNKKVYDSDENKLQDELTSLHDQILKYQRDIENLQTEKRNLTSEFLENIEFERSLLKSSKSELAEKENDLLNLKKEKDSLVQELNEVKQSDNLRIVNLENEIKKVKDRNHQLHLDLCSLQRVVNEKSNYIEYLQSELDSIRSTYHSEESCPYKKEALDYKNKAEECNNQLSHDREIFELWKTNMEQDIQCKVSLIEDLEDKLTKEIQQTKEERLSKSELCCKLGETEEKLKKLEEKICSQWEQLNKEKSETEEKIKKLEEKISSQREQLNKEKSKLEQEIKKREIYESKVSVLEDKYEKLVNNISLFLKEVSIRLGKDIPDLKTVSFEIGQLLSAIDEEKENVKQLDEECETLNTNLSYLEKELGKLYEKDCAASEHLKQEMDKLKEQQSINMKVSVELKSAKESILSLQKEIEELVAQHEREKKAFEINVDNLLEDKQKLQTLFSESEKKVKSMASTIEALQNKDNQKMQELSSEINHLKMRIVEKTRKISNLEMRLVGDGLPFQKRAEAAENKVEELSRELKSLRYNLSSRETTSSATSPFSVRATPESSRRQEEAHKKIMLLEEEIKKLQKDKSALKKIALLRHREIKELQERLGIIHSQEFSQQDSLK